MMDDKLIELRDAINEYIKAKKFYSDLKNSTDVKILINGEGRNYRVTSPLPQDYSVTCEENLEQLNLMLEGIVIDTQAKVYQLIDDCADCKTIA
jgi:hypothetical protein